MMGAAGAAGEKVYVEDVFSTYLYTGNDSTQTITNGIDLSGEGGLVWLKNRSLSASHALIDTELGGSQHLRSNSTDGSGSSYSISFNVDGFSIGSSAQDVNESPRNYASWTFRKAEKFFDVVTYTGTGANRTVTHNLGSAPGCMIIKRTDSTSDWIVYHREMNNVNPASYYAVLNSNNARQSSDLFQDLHPTSAHFTLNNWAEINASGGTYVAYLFAHDAGGFGDSGDESVIKCGSYTGNGAADGQAIDLGWEPQWLMIKGSSVASNWQIIDTMRGATVATGGTRPLRADLSNAEYQGDLGYPYATGFVVGPSTNTNNSGSTYIYIAIRRGPMKTPTDATEVFAASTAAANTLFTTGITSLDGAFIVNRTINGGARFFFSRLTASRGLDPTSTAAEANYGTAISWDLNNAFYQSAIGSSVQWLFRRAPGFFDVVAYTGTGASTLTLAHNLGVEPEFIIQKCRSNSFEWWCWHKDLSGATGYIWLQSNAAKGSSISSWGNTLPTTTQFTVGGGLNTSARTFITYLFATCPGISKVGSYTGTGTTLDIDCGFTAGARFVMIKRTDSTGDWYVYDSARGIVSGNDPYLLINSTAAEVTSTDYIDPLSSGFQISSTAPAAINASGGSFIFLAIA
jgi:hypothetical protein